MNKATDIAGPNLLARYGCGPIQFSGTNDALYERHLLFDDIVAPTAAGVREQFEAAARSARDILSQRWVRTQSTYDRENPKRVYYLSMEFLIGALPQQQRNQPAARLLCSTSRPAKRPRLVRSVGARARCRPRERWARAACRLLSRLDGDDAAAGDGLWPAL